MNIAPTKKWRIRKSEGKPFVQSGKNSNVEKRLYILYILSTVTMADRDLNFAYF